MYARRNIQFTRPTQTKHCVTQRNVVCVPPTKGYGISDALKQMLVDSVACGDSKIAAAVAANFNVIECIAGAGSCKTPDVQLIHLQVGLADFALDQARSLIDQVKVRGEANGQTHFRASGYRDAEAQKNSQGTSVFKSRANSTNSFTRTSAARESSLSTSRAQADGSFLNIGSDRSTRQQNASTTDSLKAKSVTEGTGDGCSTYQMARENTTNTQTGQNPNLVSASVAAVPRFKIEITPDNLLLVAAAGIHLVVAGPVLTSQALPVFKIGKSSCGSITPDAGSAPTGCGIIPPSVGYSARTSVQSSGNWSIGLPVVGVISSATGTGTQTSIHEKYEQVCTRGRGTVEGESKSCLRYVENTDGTSHGETHSLSSGGQNQAVSRQGDSLKTSASKLHAESAGSMDSCGESHSQAQRLAHGEAQNTGTSSSRGEHHSESETKFQSVAKSISEARYFNQIFKQLKQLRELLFKELMELEARKRASLGPVATCAKPRGISAPPMFWFVNSFVCGKHLTSACACRK